MVARSKLRLKRQSSHFKGKIRENVADYSPIPLLRRKAFQATRFRIAADGSGTPEASPGRSREGRARRRHSHNVIEAIPKASQMFLRGLGEGQVVATMPHNIHGTDLDVAGKGGC